MREFWKGFEKRAAPRWLKELRTRGLNNKALASHLRLEPVDIDVYKKYKGVSLDDIAGVQKDNEKRLQDLSRLTSKPKDKVKNIGSDRRYYENKKSIRDAFFPKHEGELSVPELKQKGHYEKIPGVGYKAPMNRNLKDRDYESKPFRLIGKEKGTVRLYHGTAPTSADSIVREGLRAEPHRDAFATPDESLASRYGKALLEKDVPISDISGLGGYYGGTNEYRMSKPTMGWKIKSIRKD